MNIFELQNDASFVTSVACAYVSQLQNIEIQQPNPKTIMITPYNDKQEDIIKLILQKFNIRYDLI
jgi:hypothetical protein